MIVSRPHASRAASKLRDERVRIRRERSQRGSHGDPRRVPRPRGHEGHRRTQPRRRGRRSRSPRAEARAGRRRRHAHPLLDVLVLRQPRGNAPPGPVVRERPCSESARRAGRPSRTSSSSSSLPTHEHQPAAGREIGDGRFLGERDRMRAALRPRATIRIPLVRAASQPAATSGAGETRSSIQARSNPSDSASAADRRAARGSTTPNLIAAASGSTSAASACSCSR